MARLRGGIALSYLSPARIRPSRRLGGPPGQTPIVRSAELQRLSRRASPHQPRIDSANGRRRNQSHSVRAGGDRFTNRPFSTAILAGGEGLRAGLREPDRVPRLARTLFALDQSQRARLGGVRVRWLAAPRSKSRPAKARQGVAHQPTAASKPSFRARVERSVVWPQHRRPCEHPRTPQMLTVAFGCARAQDRLRNPVGCTNSVARSNRAIAA
jgi:hypothetical protein